MTIHSKALRINWIPIFHGDVNGKLQLTAIGNKPQAAQCLYLLADRLYPQSQVLIKSCHYFGLKQPFLIASK